MTAEAQLDGFIEKFAPEMRHLIRTCSARLQERFPDAVRLVYDNYNFLVIGFGPTARPSEAVFSLAAHRRGVNLCFLQRGRDLPDPTGMLRGSGTTVRNVAIGSADDFDRLDVQALIDAAQELASRPMRLAEGPELIIRSVSAKQRPRC